MRRAVELGDGDLHAGVHRRQRRVRGEPVRVGRGEHEPLQHRDVQLGERAGIEASSAPPALAEAATAPPAASTVAISVSQRASRSRSAAASASDRPRPARLRDRAGERQHERGEFHRRLRAGLGGRPGQRQPVRRAQPGQISGVGCGAKGGDKIITVAGHPVGNWNQLHLALKSQKAGSTVPVVISAMAATAR